MRRLLLLLLISSLSQAQVSDFAAADFVIADNIAKLNKGRSLDDLGTLVFDLTYKLPSDVEKFRAIHTWVCDNIIGDYSQHSKVLRKRRRLQNDSDKLLEWNETYRQKAFKKLIRRKRTMCTGYAYLIREMCFLAGIEAKIIDGYARSPESNVEALEYINHSWNAVKLNNKWYLCDATWSSGYIDENSMFVKDYNDGYFLAEPQLFAKNHYPINRKWLLNQELIQKKFKPGPIVYGEAFAHKSTPIFPENLIVDSYKNEPLEFLLKAENLPIDKIALLHTFRKGERQLPITDLKEENGFIRFNHKFMSKGYYDVHVMVHDDIIASYTIKVNSKMADNSLN